MGDPTDNDKGKKPEAGKSSDIVKLILDQIVTSGDVGAFLLGAAPGVLLSALLLPPAVLTLVPAATGGLLLGGFCLGLKKSALAWFKYRKEQRAEAKREAKAEQEEAKREAKMVEDERERKANTKPPPDASLIETANKLCVLLTEYQLHPESEQLLIEKSFYESGASDAVGLREAINIGMTAIRESTAKKRREVIRARDQDGAK